MVSTLIMAADSTFRGARRQGETYSAFCYTSPMEEPHERLQAARLRAGFTEATDAARAFGWNENTYRSHENGVRGLKPEVASRYAKRLKVSAGWLLTGEGTMVRHNVVAIMGKIGAGAEILPAEEQIPPDGLYEIEAPFPLPDDAIAFEVTGESMWPRYDPGDVIVCYRLGINPNEIIGWEAAVRTKDGRRYLKRVLQGSAKGSFDLESHNAPPIRGIQLDWCAAIHAVIRSGQWRKLDEAGRRRMLKKMTD